MEDDVPDLVYKKVAIKPAPPQVQGPPNPGVGGGPQRDQLPEDLHPPQDGVGSPLSPEVEANRDADCPDQLAQKSLPQPPPQEQGQPGT